MQGMQLVCKSSEWSWLYLCICLLQAALHLEFDVYWSCSLSQQIFKAIQKTAMFSVYDEWYLTIIYQNIVVEIKECSELDDENYTLQTKLHVHWQQTKFHCWSSEGLCCKQQWRFSQTRFLWVSFHTFSNAEAALSDIWTHTSSMTASRYCWSHSKLVLFLVVEENSAQTAKQGAGGSFSFLLCSELHTVY